MTLVEKELQWREAQDCRQWHTTHHRNLLRQGDYIAASIIGWRNGSETIVFLSFLHSYRVFRRNFQHKKHKTWDGDAVLVVSGSKGTLYDLDGKSYVDITHRWYI